MESYYQNQTIYLLGKGKKVHLGARWQAYEIQCMFYFSVILRERVKRIPITLF